MTDAAPTARAAAGMGVIAAVSRTAGFVRVLVIAAVLGVGYLGDAFQSANLVSNVLFELLAAGALSAVLVPPFVRLLDAGDQEGAEEVAGGILGVAVVGLGAVALLGVVGAPLLARLLTLGVPDAIVDDQRSLVTSLLRWFVPQVVLYAAGTIAIAVLHARRRFAVTVAAPMGNTVVTIVCLVLFSLSVEGAPTFDLSTWERGLLIVAGTGGVVGFVGILLVACERSGFRLRPRWTRGDERVREVLRHSGWGVVLHTAAGLLLGAAVVAGSSESGAVVAYQVGWVFFLAPYAILAQPIHTAVLPELVGEAADEDLERFRSTVRWAVERMALFVLPVTAALVAFALPGMRAVSFGEASGEAPELLAAALASLGAGLLPYGAFLLLARVSYALGDSRTPGLIALASAAAGVAVMAAGAAAADGTALVALLGAGHSVAYALGCVALGWHLTRRVGGSLVPAALWRMAAVAGVAGGAVWLAGRPFLDDGGRFHDIALLAAAGLVGGALVLGGYRLLGLPGSLTQRAGGPPAVPEGAL